MKVDSFNARTFYSLLPLPSMLALCKRPKLDRGDNSLCASDLNTGSAINGFFVGNVVLSGRPIGKSQSFKKPLRRMPTDGAISGEPFFKKGCR